MALLPWPEQLSCEQYRLTHPAARRQRGEEMPLPTMGNLVGAIQAPHLTLLSESVLAPLVGCSIAGALECEAFRAIRCEAVAPTGCTLLIGADHGVANTVRHLASPIMRKDDGEENNGGDRV